MKNEVKNAKRGFGLGFLLAGAAVGAGATLLALFKHQKREQVYHEAEIKAMNELDDLMAENESACASCDCLDDCAAQGGDCCDGQISISEEPPEGFPEGQDAPEAEAAEEEAPETDEEQE
ncbi:hypothetical protein LI291_06225 [Intestinibacillus massiliensis]|uniref:hypothetical protein n=1 Tax=Intestinibacillus massiliensis TaxID=1871029 RepID=UPI000B357736|nr:hypothetical protein [Intestinibacillus massiliensis]MCB6365768.1 hypothetical protein [Intestinibacillus massiliensis]